MTRRAVLSSLAVLALAILAGCPARTPRPLPPPQAMLSHPTGIHSVAFAPDGKMVAVGLDDGQVRIWDDIAKSNAASTLGAHKTGVALVAFVNEGKGLLTVALDGEVSRRTAPWKGASDHTFTTDKKGIVSAVLSPEGKFLATLGQDKRIRVWELGKDKVALAWERAGDTHCGLAFAPDSKTLAGFVGQTIVWMDAVSGGEKDRLDLGKAFHRTVDQRSLTWSRDGKVMVATDGGLALIEERKAVAGRVNPVPPSKRNWGRAAAAVFSPAGDNVACLTTGGGVCVWPISIATQPMQWHERGLKHLGNIDAKCIAFSPDGKTLVVGCGDGDLRPYTLAEVPTWQGW